MEPRRVARDIGPAFLFLNKGIRFKMKAGLLATGQHMGKAQLSGQRILGKLRGAYSFSITVKTELIF